MTQKRKTLEVLNAERDEFNKLGNFANCKTLRDYFAGLALPSIMNHWAASSYQKAAEDSYSMADAMLEARKTPPKGDTP
jgi:hypothetical protein